MVEAANAAPTTPDELGELDTATPAEQGTVEGSEHEADKSTAAPDAYRALQAEYTRSQQRWASLRSELGLAKNATPDEILEQFRSRLSEAPAVEAEVEEPLDPRVEELELELYRERFARQQAIYGEQRANDIIELANIARTTDDPAELIPSIVAFMDAWVEALAAEMTAAPEGAPEATTAAPHVDIDLNEPSAGPTADQSLDAELDALRRGRDPNRLGEGIRAIFARAGAYTTRPE